MRGGGVEMRSCNLGDDRRWGFGGEIGDGNSEREKGESWRAVREVLEMGERITRMMPCNKGGFGEKDG